MCSIPESVDAKSENVPGTQNKVKGQLQNNKIIDKRLLSMSSPAYIISIKFADTIQDVLVACIV